MQTQPHSAMRPTLIFPAGMPGALDYLEKCKREGLPVIGSSSLAYDVSKSRYPAWSYLPYITEPEFKDALKKTLAEHNIGGIYSPNPVAWNYLKKNLHEIDPQVTLVNDSPVNDALGGYREAQMLARKLRQSPLQLASSLPAKPALSELELSVIFRHGNVITGMCDNEKISALCEMARVCPMGDVVEIGSWWGKSAFVLARLAQCYGIGSTLCVDPWASEHLVQHDQAGLVDSGIAQYDCDEALRVFQINLLPYSRQDINYLRLPSTEAAKRYATSSDIHSFEIHSEAFGTTQYSGEIAILHIDGNHSIEAAQADMQAWAPHVKAHGWIVVDDYVWPYGDGPQRVGDAFLADNLHRISSAFVMGTALFMQVAA